MRRLLCLCGLRCSTNSLVRAETLTASAWNIIVNDIIDLNSRVSAGPVYVLSGDTVVNETAAGGAAKGGDPRLCGLYNNYKGNWTWGTDMAAGTVSSDPKIYDGAVQYAWGASGCTHDGSNTCQSTNDYCPSYHAKIWRLKI